MIFIQRKITGFSKANAVRDPFLHFKLGVGEFFFGTYLSDQCKTMKVAYDL